MYGLHIYRLVLEKDKIFKVIKIAPRAFFIFCCESKTRKHHVALGNHSYAPVDLRNLLIQFSYFIRRRYLTFWGQWTVGKHLTHWGPNLGWKARFPELCCTFQLAHDAVERQLKQLTFNYWLIRCRVTLLKQAFDLPSWIFAVKFNKNFRKYSVKLDGM